MKNIVCIILLPFFISCNSQPTPLVAGKDVCHYCKMPVADTKFGAEIITEKGKLYKFDDIICMIGFMKEKANVDEKIKNTFVVSYTNNQKLVNTAEAFFLVNPLLHSPMNSGAAGFETQKDAEALQAEFPGKVLKWEELQQIIH